MRTAPAFSRFIAVLAVAVLVCTIPLLAQDTQSSTILDQQGPAPPLSIQSGTIVTIRLNDALSSDRNQSGDIFSGTLTQPIIVQGIVVARRGQTVAGRVTEAKKAGMVSGVSHLGITLTTVTLADGQNLPIRSQLLSRSGRGSEGRDAALIGGTTATGAVIGAAAGYGRGAAIGAGAGAVVGTLGVLLTRGYPTIIYPETILTFQITDPAPVYTDDAPQAFRAATDADYPQEEQRQDYEARDEEASAPVERVVYRPVYVEPTYDPYFYYPYGFYPYGYSPFGPYYFSAYPYYYTPYVSFFFGFPYHNHFYRPYRGYYGGYYGRGGYYAGGYRGYGPVRRPVPHPPWAGHYGGRSVPRPGASAFNRGPSRYAPSRYSGPGRYNGGGVRYSSGGRFNPGNVHYGTNLHYGSASRYGGGSSYGGGMRYGGGARSSGGTHYSGGGGMRSSGGGMHSGGGGMRSGGGGVHSGGGGGMHGGGGGSHGGGRR